MRGHITKRGKDSYTIVLNLGRDPATGKRKQQWISVKGTKKEAEKKLAQLLHQMDTGTFMKPGQMTVKDYLEVWLKNNVWPNLAPRTAESYQHIVKQHIIPTLGRIKLTDLKPEHLQKVYSDKLTNGRQDGNGGLSNRTVRYIHVTLHKALQDALKLGIIGRNPADAVEPPRLKRREIQTMSESDIHILLEYAKSTPYYTLFYLAIFTGMRRSELLALRWSDIDLLLCQVSVSRTLHHLKSGEIVVSQTKTDRSRRLISLSPSTALALKTYREEQETLCQLTERVLTEDDYVFSQIDGKPLLPDTITHAWSKLTRRVGIKGVRLHDARHTHASLMLKQGIHPKIVQERLGHSSIQVTLDTYSHVAPGLQQAAANSFDKIVFANPENQVIDKKR